MGTIDNAIQAIAQDGSLTIEEKRAAMKVAKRDGIINVKQNQIDNLLPHTFDFGDGRTLEVTDFSVGETQQGTPWVEVQVVFRKNAVVEYTGPWKIVNPPLLVPDSNGEVTRNDEALGQVKFRESVLDAFVEVAKGQFV